MTMSRILKLFPHVTVAGMAFAALYGCSSLPATPGAPTVTGHAPLQLFPDPGGKGSLQVKVVDRRGGFQTQAIADADSWDHVGLRLNGSQLQAPRATTLTYGSAGFSQPRQLDYATNALGSLPPGTDYQLAVSLASGSTVVGQGASTSITVVAGATTSVIISINTVGAIQLQNAIYKMATGSPELSQGVLGFPQLMGSSSVDVSPTFPTTGSTTAHYFAELDDLTGNFLASTSLAPVAAAGSASLFVPDLPAGDTEDIRLLRVIGLDASNQITTTKTRDVLIYRPATVKAGFN